MTIETDTNIKNLQKIGAINTLRFLAAIAVLFYHFSYVFFTRGLPYVDMHVMRYLFKYGYLGVDLFFIISGFVISLSIEGRGAFDFVKSRLGRLYPLFWVSAIITSLFLLFGGHIVDSQISWYRFLTNMTMIPTILFNKDNIDLIDGSYWTLAVEMKFYLIILLLLLFKQIKHLEKISIVGSVLILMTALFAHIQPESDIIWISSFMAGIIFYKIYKHGLNNWRIFVLCNSFLASIIFATHRDLADSFRVLPITLFILSFYIIFILISNHVLKIPNNKYINILGLLTYPVYLLHQQIGKILFTYADLKQIPLYISFISITLFIIILSFITHILFEKSGRKLMSKILDKITPQYLKHL